MYKREKDRKIFKKGERKKDIPKRKKETTQGVRKKEIYLQGRRDYTTWTIVN